MSGLVSTRLACSRANRRPASSESPSRAPIRTDPGARTPAARAWSWARALVGARYNATERHSTNPFVVFLSRLIGTLIDSALRRNDDSNGARYLTCIYTARL